MYGARAYLAYLRYGAMRFFQDEILRGHGNFWSRKKYLPVPYSHEYCTVPKHSLLTGERGTQRLSRLRFGGLRGNFRAFLNFDKIERRFDS